MNRKPFLWIPLISLLFIIGSTQAFDDAPIQSSNPLFQLRQELVGTIHDIHTNGDTGLEEALAELVTQLEHMQSAPGEPMKLDWEQAEHNLTSTKSVCMVVSSFEGLYINSGIGTAYYALAELLVRLGHSVTVLYTRDQPPTVGSFNDWVNHYAKQGIQLKSLPPSATRITNPKLQAVSAQVYAYLKTNHFDIVHYADFEGLGFYSALAKRVGVAFADTLFVAGLHGPTRWVLDANEKRAPFHETELEVDFMERVSVENADVVWTPSNAMASWLSQQGWNLTNVHLLPLPPGPEVSAVELSHVKAKEFVFFGRLETRKGLMLFCDSVDLLNSMNNIKHGLSITFLGTSGFVDGQDSIAYIQARAARWSFKVNIITNATREAALNYLKDKQANRVPVIPSLVDNAPYTVYECLYSGIPFLASATPSITPLLTKAGHHLFDLKPHHLASRMAYAVKTGLSSAHATFSAQEAEDTWLSFYSALALPQVAPATEEQPLVSVCLVHYNRPVLVQQALDSILSQDYKNLEVILVDDGSNSTEAIQFLESIQNNFDTRGWKIIRTENKYLGAARNTAAKEAKGQFLVFLDDDNVAYANQISSYVKAAQKTKAQIITAGHAVFEGTSAPTAASIDRYWFPLGASLAVGLYKNCFGDANFFVQREIFLALGGFTEEHSVGLEEHEFYAKAVLAGYHLEVIPEPLLYYRMHDESTQMVFTLDPRLGEARRIRPYINALAPSHEIEKKQEQAVKTRRSLVQLVARNTLDTFQDCNQTLSSVSPSNGPISGGTTISLKGIGFSCGVQAVRIDKELCTGINMVSNYELTCQTPVGKRSSVAVDVEADVGGKTIALYGSFTYNPADAPALKSCRLDNSGSSIACSFAPNTDESSGSCSKFFGSASAFGNGANCYWTSNTILTIDLGTGASILIGDDISINAGVVNAQGDSSSSNEASSTPLLAPLQADTPTASIGSSSTVASCEGITLDGSSSTGAMGRSLKYSWALVSVNPENSVVSTAISALITAANTQGSSSVAIPASDVVAASYVFRLTVTNWIGGSATTTTSVTKTENAVPTVSISGSSVVEINKNSPLTLTGQATSSCGSTLGSVTYQWTISPSVSLDSTTSATLSIPENTLNAGSTYTVTFTATDNGLSNSASVTVKVGVRALVASISGGNKQYELATTVNLDGSASSDPEGGSISYAWSCVDFYDSSKPCSVSASTTSSFSFAASTIGAGKYTVSLTVSGTEGRTASTSAWVEVVGVAVLSISIQALSSNTINPSQSLSLVGVLNQGGVEESDVTWQWSLDSGSLADASSAYLSATTAQTLIIAPNALTAGSQYTYKLTATQTSTGITGSATVSFNVYKAPTGEFTCAALNGNAEETDFTYDFASTSATTYELRFVPSGSSLEIPAAEPGTSSSITTKLPYGKYTIVGVATSSAGVSTRKECSADVTYSSVSDGLSALADLASQSGLSAFQIARYAFGAEAAFVKAGSSKSSTFEQIRASLVSAASGATSGLSSSSVTALTGAFVVLTNADHGILSSSDLFKTARAFRALVLAQRSVSNINTAVFIADVEILSNLIEQASNQDFDVKVLIKRDTAADSDMWATFQSLIELADQVAQQYLSQVSSGQSQINIEQSLLTLSLYASSASAINSQGVTVGKKSTVKLPANAVPSGMNADTMTFALSSWGVSPYPSSSAIVSPVLILSTSAAGSAVDLGELSSPATIYVPNSELLETSNLACVSWSASNNNWTTDGCQTASSNNGVTCQCDRVAPVAVTSLAASRATPNNKGDGGLDGKWIAVIAAVGGVALIAVIVGTVIGVKRHRRGSAPRTASAAAAPVAAVIPAVASSSDASAVAVPIAGAAVPATPNSVSSYSSASSRSIVSSSSSEEEQMEQQIKDIVGELSTAMPRDPRALEVLGDRLDME